MLVWFLSLAVAGAVAEGPASASPSPVKVVAPAPSVAAASLLAADTRRIRAATPRVGKLIDEGVQRSRTFAQLVNEVHETNVIVYIEATFGLPPDVSGRILLAGVAGQQRYLRVQVLYDAAAGSGDRHHRPRAPACARSGGRSHGGR